MHCVYIHEFHIKIIEKIKKRNCMPSWCEHKSNNESDEGERHVWDRQKKRWRLGGEKMGEWCFNYYYFFLIVVRGILKENWWCGENSQWNLKIAREECFGGILCIHKSKIITYPYILLLLLHFFRCFFFFFFSPSSRAHDSTSYYSSFPQIPFLFPPLETVIIILIQRILQNKV